MLGLCQKASWIASCTDSSGERVSTMPSAAHTHSASSISRSTWASRAGSVHTCPTVSPVRAESGLVAELKTTLVHCGPRASASAWVTRPPRVSRPASRAIRAGSAGLGSNGPNDESPGAS